MDENFRNAVYSIVADIPEGYVSTYGAIAALIGRPRNARLVGRAMSMAPRDLTSHRVVNASGATVRGWAEQREYLLNEGVEFKANGCVNLKKHLWVMAENYDRRGFR